LDRALNALWKSELYRGAYASPNRFALARAKASVKTVVEDLTEIGEEEPEPVVQHVADLPYSFTYDGTSLTANWVLPDHGFDVAKFKAGSSVGVEVSVLGYRMENKDPGYSLGMRGVYHLANSLADPREPVTPVKRKGGCLVSPRRRKGARRPLHPRSFQGLITSFFFSSKSPSSSSCYPGRSQTSFSF
jgi:hypothetical protein